MPFNASGLFQRLYSWVTDRDTGVKILAERMDGEFNNFKAGLDSLTEGEVSWRGPFKAQQGTLTSLGYTFNNDADTGFYRSAPNQISAVLGGVDVTQFTGNGITTTGLIANSATVNGSPVLTEGKEGAGNGLDADTVDGHEAAHLLDAGNLTGTLAPGRLTGTYNIGISGTAANAAQLNNQDPSHYLAFANATGTLNASQLPTVFTAPNAAQLGGQDPAHFLDLANATGLLDASKVSGGGGPVDAATLDGFDSSDFLKVTDDGSLAAATLGGQNSSYFRNAANLNTGRVPTSRLSGTYNINITGSATADVYTGSSVNNTNFPVGTSLLVSPTLSAPNRNGSQTVRLGFSGNTTFGGSGGNSVISGTWRCRGAVAEGSGQPFLMQRVA